MVCHQASNISESILVFDKERSYKNTHDNYMPGFLIKHSVNNGVASALYKLQTQLFDLLSVYALCPKSREYSIKLSPFTQYWNEAEIEPQDTELHGNQ